MENKGMSVQRHIVGQERKHPQATGSLRKYRNTSHIMSSHSSLENKGSVPTFPRLRYFTSASGVSNQQKKLNRELK